MRFDFHFGAAWCGHDPDMSWMFWIDITFVIFSIHRAGNHAHIALMLIFRRRGLSRGSWRGLVRRSLGGGGLLVFLLFLFRQILRIRIACERDIFCVWRPDRTASTSRQIGKNKGIAAGHRQHCELWRFRLAVLFARPQE